MLRHRLLPLLVIWVLAILACGLAAAAPAQPDRPAPQRIPFNPMVCDQIATAIPEPGVTYQPGLDADGHRVAPADVPGTPDVRLPRAFPIGLNFYVGDPGDPAQQEANPPQTPDQPGGGPQSGILLSPEGQIGEIAVVEGPGGMRMYFNGQPLTDPSEAQIRDACADWKARRHG